MKHQFTIETSTSVYEASSENNILSDLGVQPIYPAALEVTTEILWELVLGNPSPNSYYLKY